MLEQALARAPDREARILRRAELESWIDRHEPLMFGSLAWLRRPLDHPVRDYAGGLRKTFPNLWFAATPESSAAWPVPAYES